jgi:hypothetical protein
LLLPLAGLLAAIVWAVLRAGVGLSWTVGDAEAAAAAWPHRLDSWMMSFYTDSPLYILVARVAGADTHVEFLRLSAVAIAVAVLGLAAWAFAAARPEGRWRSARLIVLAPVTAVLVIQIGLYDPYTIIAWVIALFAWLTGSRTLIVLGGALLGFQHFEQTLMGAAALLLAWLALRDQLRDPLNRTNPAWLIPGIFAGKAILIGILLAAGETAMGRSEWLGQYFVTWTKVAIVTGPSLLWSLFAGLWALVIAMWLRHPEWRTRGFLIASFAIGVVATLVSGDRPRVFTMVMTPAVAVLIVAFSDHTPKGSKEGTLVESVVGVGPPLMLAAATVVNTNVIDTGIIALLQMLGR